MREGGEGAFIHWKGKPRMYMYIKGQGQSQGQSQGQFNSFFMKCTIMVWSIPQVLKN